MYPPKTESNNDDEHGGKDFALTVECIFLSCAFFSFMYTDVPAGAPSSHVDSQVTRRYLFLLCTGQHLPCTGFLHLTISDHLFWVFKPQVTSHVHIYEGTHQSSKIRIRIQTISNINQKKKTPPELEDIFPDHLVHSCSPS